MKRGRRVIHRAIQIVSFALVICLLLSACGQSGGGEHTWQGQYDLGARYLSEGNYEEAILAFTAAIEIDPMQMDAYLGLAEVYICREEYDKALEVLQTAVDQGVEDPRVTSKMSSVREEIFQAYRKVLDLLYNGYTRDWDFYYDRETGELIYDQAERVSYLWYWPYASDTIHSLSDMGYMLIDLNGDGVPELITSVFSEYWGSGDGFIYDLFTYHEGKLIDLDSSGERHRYYLCSDNTLWYEGSSGADDSHFGYYRINEAKTGLEEIAGNDAPVVPLQLTSLADYRPEENASNRDQEQAPESDGSKPDVSLLPADYLGMTIHEMAELWGHDYQLDEYWFEGTAKGVYYGDSRTSLWFYFQDPDYTGKANGDEEIFMVECWPNRDRKLGDIAPGLSSRLTYSQLTDMGYEGIIFGEGDLADMGEGVLGEKAMVAFEYQAGYSVDYSWVSSDPFSAPADFIVMTRQPN